MVKYSDRSLDTTFAALADPTRRAILTRLARGESSVTELAQPFDMSLPAISKHLRVLENAGLLTRSKDGRLRRCCLVPGPMKDAALWIARYRRFWEGQFDALARHLEGPEKRGEHPWPARSPARRRPSSSGGSLPPRGKKSSRPGRIRKR
ncbi:MAG: winged helix-turn-helix transcriptional regulator [candidate division NC10 bacterium]|nr:winged helix-turn-helix transcriptional regulator [candidate division NC10 bacterium]MBI2163912.1 winged helix-turn-helix transcriptional regulator [candidate division NC10 bacterium]MBI2457559.1 winged helix-turn-helix transcriptional regulator [candidate division NC10 bacterium]